MLRLLSLLAAGLMGASLLAQSAPAQAKSVVVVVPQSGSWALYTRDKAGSSPEPLEAESARVKVPSQEGKVVGLVNVETNRAAERSLSGLKADAEWEPKASEFNRIAEVKVVVSRERKAVASGVVTLTAGSESFKTILSPSDQGEALFKSVPAKALSAVVEVKVGDRTEKTPPVTLTPGPSGPVALAVEVAAEVETVEEKEAPAPAAAKAGGDGEEAKPAAGPGQSPFALILNVLIGLAILGGLGYAVFMYFKKDPKQAAELLKKAGLDPSDPDKAGPPDPVAAPAPKPLQPIVLENSAPEPPAGPVVMGGGAAASATTGSPRLTLEAGGHFAIPEGEVTVGRDAGMGLVLPADKGVSRTHAILRRQGQQVVVVDSGSTNGTYVNGQKVTGEAVLRPGDLVIFGAARCRFEA